MYSFQSEGLGSVVITSFGIDELLAVWEPLDVRSWVWRVLCRLTAYDASAKALHEQLDASTCWIALDAYDLHESACEWCL